MTSPRLDRLVEQVAWATADTIPFFTSDPWPAYFHALVKLYGEGTVPPAAGRAVLLPNPDDDRLPTCCMPK